MYYFDYIPPNSINVFNSIQKNANYVVYYCVSLVYDQICHCIKPIIIFLFKSIIHIYIYFLPQMVFLITTNWCIPCTIIIKVCIIYKHEHNLLIIYRSGGFHISSSIFSLSLCMIMYCINLM